MISYFRHVIMFIDDFESEISADCKYALLISTIIVSFSVCASIRLEIRNHVLLKLDFYSLIVWLSIVSRSSTHLVSHYVIF